jgi:predicted nucleic acid-binding protein
VLHRAQSVDPIPSLVADFKAALTRGQLRGSTVVKLELLHNARNPQEVLAAEQELDQLPTLPVTVGASRAAVAAVRQLASTSDPGNPVYHRIKNIDALIAGTAWAKGFGVLHYDGHYERLARVLNFDQHWIAPAGAF